MVIVLSLPGLKVLSSVPFLPKNNHRVLSTVTFLNDGIGAYLTNPFELQRFSYTEVILNFSKIKKKIFSGFLQPSFQEKYEDFQLHLPNLYTERKLKERSQNSFLTSLFSNKRESVDRDNLFEGSGYSKSRSNNTVQNLDPSVLEQSVSATGEFRL